MRFLFGHIIFSAGVFLGATVLAAGGGGGGSVPDCSGVAWNCTEWSECSQAGLETRTCTFSQVPGCGAPSEPKPPEGKTCTPPPLPSPPKEEVVPIPPSSAPICSADVWECGDWQECDSEGRESRLCRRVVDCPQVQTPSPATLRQCSRLQCGSKAELKERVLCRLKLTPAGLARELAIQYLPEECRSLKDVKTKGACINLYRSFGPCWEKPEGEERLACGRNALKLGRVVSEEVKACQGKTSKEQVACKAEVREKVFSMIKFRLYDLEERAEELIERGADPTLVADFVTLVESKKQAFNQASTKAERRQIILDVRLAWREFVLKIKDQVK